ncbi:50S ribosomal protein L17 [Candidatus Nomurabacteria bacterium]|nr:50S ribosomal protein L17 [Candidatus Nomurabacteria bacterium]
MPAYRKLGRATDVRLSMLKGMVTTLILTGRIETTEARAKEVKRIAEKLITLAIKEKDNFKTKSIKVSSAKKDSKGRKVLVSKTSKNGNKYDVVERTESEEMVQVDDPSRLAARKELIKYSGELLKPTRLYARHVLGLKRKIKIKGIANITGGAF